MQLDESDLGDAWADDAPKGKKDKTPNKGKGKAAKRHHTQTTTHGTLAMTYRSPNQVPI